jgi:hypothetical protein
MHDAAIKVRSAPDKEEILAGMGGFRHKACMVG